jgi:hypothetical protein
MSRRTVRLVLSWLVGSVGFLAIGALFFGGIFWLLKPAPEKFAGSIEAVQKIAEKAPEVVKIFEEIKAAEKKAADLKQAADEAQKEAETAKASASTKLRELGIKEAVSELQKLQDIR